MILGNTRLSHGIVLKMVHANLYLDDFAATLEAENQALPLEGLARLGAARVRRRMQQDSTWQFLNAA